MLNCLLDIYILLLFVPISSVSQFHIMKSSFTKKSYNWQSALCLVRGHSEAQNLEPTFKLKRATGFLMSQLSHREEVSLNRDRKPTEWLHVPPAPKVSKLPSNLMLNCVFWQNPGAGTAQNLKNCLGHKSMVSSWVTILSNTSNKHLIVASACCTFTVQDISCCSCHIMWNWMFLYRSSVNLILWIQERLWSVLPSLSAIALNYIIKRRCLACFERVVKRDKTMEKGAEAFCDWFIFISSGRWNFFIIAAAQWKHFFLLSISEKLSWGNQDLIRPVSSSALRAVPSARIQHLARHKRDLSAREDQWR